MIIIVNVSVLSSVWNDRESTSYEAITYALALAQDGSVEENADGADRIKMLCRDDANVGGI